MAWCRIFAVGCTLLVALSFVPASSKPIVDPGLFVIQGVTSCINGTGYCMLGNNCTVDVDFLPDITGGHCDGLREAFTPKIDFVCCRYNMFGKATSKPPTTTISSYTITDVFSLIDEAVANQQQQNEDEIPEDFNPENLIDIVGVVTDFTGIVGLVTRPWTGTFPTKASPPTTTPMTPSTPTTTVAPVSPATPADVAQMMVEAITEEPTTETPTEATESYNEALTETDGPFLSNEQAIQTTQQPETSTSPTSQPSEEIEVEVAHVSVVIVDESSGTQAPPVAPASVTSINPFDGNVIIFPDNPIVSNLPLLETEALEAETESIIHMNTLEETVNSNSVQGSLTDAASSSPNESQVSSSDRPQLEAVPDQETQQQGSVGPSIAEQQQTNILPENHESSDYDYYSEYPDQLLLQPVNQNICGFKGFKNYINEVSSSSRILGGVVATTVEWCWVAAIMERRQSGDKYVCTGALVESDIVLTTATCLKRLESRDLSNYIVVLGDSNLREDLPYGIQFHRITEVVLHPDYLTSGGAHANDIGVVRLRDHATVSDNVCLVCMAQQDAIFPIQSCTVTGYGIGDVPKSMIRDVKETVPSDGVLRQMTVPIMKTPECQAALQNMTGSEILSKSNSFLCAGGLDGANACYSTMDGGSPLACEAGGRWFLAGVVSWTRDCERQGVPNVYTRVSSFSNWLQATHLRMMGFLTHQIRLA